MTRRTIAKIRFFSLAVVEASIFCLVLYFHGNFKGIQTPFFRAISTATNGELSFTFYLGITALLVLLVRKMPREFSRGIFCVLI